MTSIEHEPTSPRVARSREKLLRAATDLLVEAGPTAVTVDAVAERSGVAKSTLYRHWGSRDDMLVDVVRANLPQLDPVEIDRGFDDALRALVRSAAATLQSPEWSRIVPALLMLRATMPELADVAKADHDSRLSLLDDVLAAGVAERALRPGLDVERVAPLLYGPLLFGALSGGPGDLTTIADDVVTQFLAAHRAP